MLAIKVNLDDKVYIVKFTVDSYEVCQRYSYQHFEWDEVVELTPQIARLVINIIRVEYKNPEFRVKWEVVKNSIDRFYQQCYQSV